jgi:hypothetical protein
VLLPASPGGLEDLAQLRDVHLEGVRRCLGRVGRPESLDQAIARDDLVGVEEEDREESALLVPSERDRTAAFVDLERPENPKFHLT